MELANKKRETSILSEQNYFNICALFQRIVSWINCQNVYTFTDQKTFFHTLICFLLISSKSFIVSLYLRKKNTLFESIKCWLGTYFCFPEVQFISICQLKCNRLLRGPYDIEKYMKRFVHWTCSSMLILASLGIHLNLLTKFK